MMRTMVLLPSMTVLAGYRSSEPPTASSSPVVTLPPTPLREANRSLAPVAIEHETITYFGRRLAPLGKLAENRQFPHRRQRHARRPALPKPMTDWVPQSIAERIHYPSLYGNKRHYPGAGPNASALGKRRAEQCWAEFRNTRAVTPQQVQDRS